MIATNHENFRPRFPPYEYIDDERVIISETIQIKDLNIPLVLIKRCSLLQALELVINSRLVSVLHFNRKFYTRFSRLLKNHSVPAKSRTKRNKISLSQSSSIITTSLSLGFSSLNDSIKSLDFSLINILATRNVSYLFTEIRPGSSFSIFWINSCHLKFRTIGSVLI